jgi:carbon storage regulator
MLVLTRKEGEEIRVDDSTRIVVLSIGPGRVRLGVEAPATVPVHREEVWEELKRNGRRQLNHRPG